MESNVTISCGPLDQEGINCLYDFLKGVTLFYDLKVIADVKEGRENWYDLSITMSDDDWSLTMDYTPEGNKAPDFLEDEWNVWILNEIARLEEE